MRQIHRCLGASILLAASIATAGPGPDGIELMLGSAPGPGDMTLSWTGGTPGFEIFRSTSAAALIDPLNLDGSTATSSFVTSQTGPQLEFFQVNGLPLVDVTGTWTTVIDFAGTMRPVTLQLHQRSRGRILGFVLGGTTHRTVLDGLVVGDRLTLRLQFSEPWTSRVMTIEGTAIAGTFGATLDVGTSVQPITLTRRTDVLFERGFGLFDVDAMGEPGSLGFLAVVQDGMGTFVSGGFTGYEDCGLWACSGGLTSFSESPPNITLGLETDGGCSAGSTATIAWDPTTGMHSGTYTFNSCAGSASRSTLGFNGWRTRSDHVAEVLATLGAIADNLESGTPLASPHPSFATDYLHFGRTLGDVFGALNTEMATYERIRADFRPRRIHTVDDPDTFYFIASPPSANFEELRSGIPTGGGPPETYVDTAEQPALDLLSAIDRGTGAWIVRGNQTAALDQPFSYTSGAEQLIAPTPFGMPSYVSVGPYGSHFPPNTGHIDGNSKSDYFGFMAGSDSELTELFGDSDGVREPGEIWAYWGGAAGERVRDRRVVYHAPQDATIFEIEYEAPNGNYFDNEPQWNINMKLAGGHRLRLGHVGKVAGELRDLVLAASGGTIDTDTYAGPEGDILQGLRVPVTALTELGLPQILAEPVPGFPDYYYAGGGLVPAPHAQMEFFMGGFSGGGDIADWCFFDSLDPSSRASLQAVMDADMANPTSYAYEWAQWRAWQWKAEAKLCPQFSEFPIDFSDLYTNRGGWYERDEAGVTPDEMFVYVPIRKDVASYDPSLYHSADSIALVHRKRANDQLYTWLMPDLTIANPCWPSGEVLERGATELLIKWRNSGCMEGDNLVAFQRAAYRLDANGLAIEWGQLAAAPGTAVSPVLGAAEPCDSPAVRCYSHIAFPAFQN